MEDIRLGTIGSGPIVYSILENVRRTDGICLTAVYSRSAEKAASLAREFDPASTYTNLDVFLHSPETDFIYIATPNSLHYEQAKQALLAGKNVILEKPFCTRASQAAEIIALAKERGLYLIDATPTAFLPNLTVLHQLLPEIGPIRHVSSDYSQYSSRCDALLRGELPNVFNPAFGGGCLMDLNYYNLYLNLALFGRPQKAEYLPNFHKNLIDTSGTLILRYEDFVSENHAAKDASADSFFLIEGERGQIRIPGGSNGLRELRLTTERGEEVCNLQPEPDRWFYEVQEITRLIHSGDHEAFDRRLSLTLDAMDILEKARISANIHFPGDPE